MQNLITILIKKLYEIYKEKGISGCIKSYKGYYKNWPPLHKIAKYLLYSKFSRSKTFMREINGSKMMLSFNDFGLSAQLFISGFREPECTRLVKEQIKEGMVVYDIGANMGYYALLESRSVGPTGRVYAIEPGSDNFKFLKNNIHLNSYKNIVPERFSFGEQNTMTKLYLSDHFNYCSCMEETDSYESVNMITFDSYIKNKPLPDYIRMDVEGYEYFIVNGMKDFLTSKKPCIICIEIHLKILKDKGLSSDEIFNKLFNGGFKPTYVVKEYGDLREKAFKVNNKNEFYDILAKENMTPDKYAFGFGLFLERK